MIVLLQCVQSSGMSAPEFETSIRIARRSHLSCTPASQQQRRDERDTAIVSHCCGAICQALSTWNLDLLLQCCQPVLRDQMRCAMLQKELWPLLHHVLHKSTYCSACDGPGLCRRGDNEHRGICCNSNLTRRTGWRERHQGGMRLSKPGKGHGGNPSILVHSIMSEWNCKRSGTNWQRKSNVDMCCAELDLQPA